MAAFYGDGPWELHESVRAKYSLTKDKWASMDADAQNKYFLEFCQYLPSQRPTTIWDKEKLIELSNRVNATKGKDNQRKRCRTERGQTNKYPQNSKKSRSEFMKEFDAMCAKEPFLKWP